MMKKSLFFLLFSVLVLSACQAGNEQTAYDLRNDTTNPSLMSNPSGYHPNYDVGPRSDQNPNFLNLRGTSLNDASNRNNMGTDIDIARDIVNRTGDFTAESIWINNAGDQMTVSVDRKGRLSGDERDRAINTLHKKLVQALPRYDINIRER
ncbi:hypothetical protein V7125_00505 [Neobacillus vireti]